MSVPEGFHLQSNAPRDPSLIPTTLTFSPLPGIQATEVVFPKATDFTLQGQSEPLAVFERQFVIGVQFAVAPGRGARARSRCRRASAIRPATTSCASRRSPPRSAGRFASARGTPRAASRRRSTAQMAWGTGAPPPVEEAPPGLHRDAAARRRGVERPRHARRLRDRREHRRLSAHAPTSSTFITNAEQGVKERGLFEGRGPLAILVLVFLGGLALNLTPCVLPMIPINLAIIGAGTQGRLTLARVRARHRLRRGHGRRVRRARRRRDPHRRHLRHHQLVALVQRRDCAGLRRAGAGDVRRVHDRLLALLRRRSAPAAAAAARWRWRSGWARSRRCWPARASRRW